MRQRPVSEKNKFSIEFSENGTILDVEKTVKLKELPLDTQQKITSALEKRFRKYQLKKIQIQYVGSENAIYKEIFQLKPQQEKPIINYEIVVKGKTDKTYQSFEILLNTKGAIEKELKIKSNLSLNLEF